MPVLGVGGVGVPSQVALPEAASMMCEQGTGGNAAKDRCSTPSGMGQRFPERRSGTRGASLATVTITSAIRLTPSRKSNRSKNSLVI